MRFGRACLDSGFASNGVVLIRNPGKSEWRKVKTGARLIEGGLVRTDSSVEAGVRYKNGRTAVNNELVEVTGDGTFKHFTSPFHASAHRVRLNLKVTDLAGRTRIWTAAHDFSRHGWEN